MAIESCDGCGRRLRVAGGIAGIWSGGDEATGLTLDLEDGSTHLLCYPCIEALPDHPSRADVAALEPTDDSAVN